MKKQGDFYLKLTSILMAVLLVAYVVCSLVMSSDGAYTLETAVYCEVGDGITVSGFVVRSEELLTSEMPIIVGEQPEGQRVGGGQVVATGYTSGEARAHREELNALLSQKAELTHTLSGSDAANASVLDEEISLKIISLSKQTAKQNFEAMHNSASELEPLILRRCVSGDDKEQIEARLAQIDARIAALQTQTSGDATAIIAPMSGYYSAVVDGYETLLHPSLLSEMTLTDFRALDKQSEAVPPDAIGRLITGQTWYYVTEVPRDRIASYEEGDRLDVSFSGSDLQELRMTIYRIGSADETSCLLILSCDRKLQCVTAIRQQTADIQFGSLEGLRVPKEALYVEDGQTGVYVLEGARADWKSVEILCEYGDDYLVAWDSSDTDYLWPKDEMIITAEELTDGKVIGS